MLFNKLEGLEKSDGLLKEKVNEVVLELFIIM